MYNIFLCGCGASDCRVFNKIEQYEEGIPTKNSLALKRGVLFQVDIM